MGDTFRGWWIVAVAFLAQAITVGVTIIPFGLFTTPMVEEFGLPIAHVQLGFGLFVLTMTGSSAVIGPLLDGGSIRMLMALGSLLMTLSFLGMSVANHPWQLVVLFSVGGALGFALTGPLAATTVIAKWFDEKRGLAVGIAAIGPPAGGLLLTPLAGWLLAELGWRGTLQVFAGISALIAPLALLLVRNHPADLGQNVDGKMPAAKPTPESSPELLVWSAMAILRSRNFWGLALAMGIVFGLGGGWNANAPRFGEDLGYGAQYMAMLIGIAAGLAIPSTLFFGWLADSFDNRRLLWVVIGLQTISLVLLWTQPPQTLFVAALMLFGFAGGGLLPLYASFIGRLFGPASFGGVMGLAGLVSLPFGASSPVIAGSIRDSQGSYESAILAFAIAFAVAAFLLLLTNGSLKTGGPETHVPGTSQEEKL